MKNIPWDSLQIFLAVARSGSISAAGVRVGLSSATVGRRMLELERQTETVLFQRSQTGYALTAEGQALLDHLVDMEAAGRRLEAWNDGRCGSVRVRLCLGTWCARFVARHFGELVLPGERHAIDIGVTEERATLAHRSADIGVRAVEPQEIGLAAVRLPEVAYALYGALGTFDANAGRLVAIAEDQAISPYLRYPWERSGGDIVATVSRAEGLRHLILSGAAAGVLPCFIGDADPELARLGDEILSLRHRSWLVMNNEDRHRPEIRLVVDRLTALFRRHAALFEGREARRST